jgi:hypothetical protein
MVVPCKGKSPLERGVGVCSPSLMVCDSQRRGWGGCPFETFAISSKICYKEEPGGEGARKTEGRVLEV